MPKIFNQMATEAMARVPTIYPAEAHQQMQVDPKALAKIFETNNRA